MESLFALAMPWWEFVLRAGVVYVVLLALLRLSGKRTVGQYTPFDMVLVVLLGNAVQNSMLGEDHSLVGGLLLVATLIGLNWLLGVASSRHHGFERLVAGEAVLLARDGKLFERVLRRHNISESDFAEALHEAGCSSRDQVALAMLETDGSISIIRKDAQGQSQQHEKTVE